MTTKSFKVERLVRFRDCDPAGIVFYPRYFEMVNDVVEDWFREALGYDFHHIHVELKLGTPTVHLEVLFKRPSMIGDMLTFWLTVADLGNSSVRVRIHARCGDELRFSVTPTLVHTDMRRVPPGSLPWPEAVRARMLPFVESEDDADAVRGWDWS
ncbi:acyl-CoA thioesterase [Parapedomonas caeni]|jgi:4-hydroxybenzoyl-CoA thioesterase